MKEYLNKLKNGTKLMFKEFSNKETRKNQAANMLTFSRFIVSFIIPIFMIIGGIISSSILLGIGTGITAFGALTDLFDGAIARKMKICSEYGKLLDQFVDKVFNGSIALTLSLVNPLFLATILGEGIIAATNVLYKKKYKDLNISTTKVGKVKQFPLCISLILGFLSILIPSFPNITNAAILTTLLFQIATTSSYIIQNNKSKKILKSKQIQDYITELEKEDNKNEKVNILEKTNNKINLETNISKKEQYVKLRDLLIEIKNNKIQDESKVYEGYQKRKTL